MLRWFSGVQESKDNLRHEARFLHFVNLFLELFIGSIQALVFGILTLVFMTVAIQSHGHGDEEGEAH